MRAKFAALALTLGAAVVLRASAQSGPRRSIDTGIQGTVLDGVDRVLGSADIEITKPDGTLVATATTDHRGRFRIIMRPGVYRLHVAKPSFAPVTEIIRVRPSELVLVRVLLGLAPLQQALVVTATGVATPPIQLGQSVHVMDRDQIQDRNGLTLDDALRELPGVQVTRTGAVGGITSVMLRGGDASFSKILLDGVPVQRFDFGSYDFSTLAPESLESVTVVNGADSVVYGSDAASGVIDVRSRNGQDVASPELILHTASGSFGTAQNAAQFLGNWRPVDYAFAFGYLDTANELPRSQAWNQSWSGNVGLRLPAHAHLRAVLHRVGSRAGDPNAFDFFGVADDSWQRQGETYFSLSGAQQTTSKWTNSFTLSQSTVNYSFETASPTGTPYDPCTPTGFPACPNYLGRPVTITGANGYSVHGQAILDFGGDYPVTYQSDTLGRFATFQSTFALAPGWAVSAGYRYSNDRGLSAPAESWHNNGVFAEASGGIRDHVFGSAGVSEDWHSRFGNTWNPQASLAVLPRLNRGGWWDELRLRASAGTALKDPNLTQDQNSLYTELLAAGSSPAALGVGPMHSQRAHTVEIGLDQYLAADRVRASLTWFDDRYYDLVQFVPDTAFPQLGVPATVTAAAQALGGAYLNAWSESSKGVEMALLVHRGGWQGGVSYNYLVPLVLQSFSSDASSPSYNPAFPNVPIGAYSPLTGARPFNVAPESGSLRLGYRTARWQLQGDAYITGRRDGSTFLSDANFGPSMLLPNHDLAPAYGLLNLTGFFQINARVTLEGVVSNALNQSYQEVFGYPALGRSVRIGIRFRLKRPRG